MAKRNSLQTNQENQERKNKLELVLNYNPYTYENFLEGISLENSSRLGEFLYQNNYKQLQLWYRQLFQQIGTEFNVQSFSFKFKGRESDFIDINEEIETLNNDGWEIEAFHECTAKDNSNIYEDLTLFVNKLKEKAPKELLDKMYDKKAFEEFENSQNTEAYVSVIATMSSGKSTLINAILEEELLPSKNEACTATIAKIKDIDEMENFKVKVEDLDGNEIYPWQDATNEFLTEVNEKGNEKGLNINLEGDIPGISSQEMNLVIIDTPGPNNSQNAEHKAATYRYIKDNESNPLVLYVMNATQHATNDDNRLLTEIADIIKEKGKQAEERFLFALNKIDCFDVEKENVEKLIENNKKYLKSKGIENPKIFPISAEFAKLKKLYIADKPLSRAQKNNLKNFEFNFIPDPDDNYEGIDTIKYASIPKNLREELYTESQQDYNRAHLNYSGITAIEKYIDNYVSKYAKTQKIKDSITTIKQILDASYHEINSVYGKTIDEIDETMSHIKLIEDEINKNGKDKIQKVKNKIEAIEPREDKFDKLLAKIGKVFSDLEDDFYDSSASENRARGIIQDATKELETLMIELQTTIDSILNEEVIGKAQIILDELKKYFANILNNVEINKELNSTLKSSFELDMPRVNSLINKGSYTERVRVGERFVKTERYGFLWLKKRDIYEDVYENQDKVDLNKIFYSEIEPLSSNFRKPVNENRSLLKKNIKELKEEGIKNVDIVENSIKNRLDELKIKLNTVSNLESESKELENNVNKIIEYKKELDSILSI